MSTAARNLGENIKRGPGRPPGSTKKHPVGNASNTAGGGIIDEESKEKLDSQLQTVMQELDRQRMQTETLCRQLTKLDIKVDLIWSKFSFITPTVVQDLIMLEE